MRHSSAHDLVLGEILGAHGSHDGLPTHLVLPGESRDKHQYVVGATGSGKSKFLESQIRQDIINARRTGSSIVLLDPHGSLYDGIMQWLARAKLNLKILPIDLRRDDWVVAYNAIRPRPDSSPSVVVDAFVRTMVHAWGAANTDQTPLLARWVTNLVEVLYEKGLTLPQAIHLLSDSEVRSNLTCKLRNAWVERDWAMAHDLNSKEFEQQVSSTVNRLRRFVGAEHLQLMLGQPNVSLDLRRALDEGWIILVSLATENGKVSRQNADLFGSMFLTDLWTAAQERGKRRGLKPCRIYVDEFQSFVSLAILRGDNMVLDEQTSERCRRIFRAFRNHEGWTDATFSHHMDGLIPPSTLSRLLNTGQRMTIEHLAPVAHLISERLPYSFDLLRIYLSAPYKEIQSDPPPAILDLEVAEIYGLREAAIKPLLGLLDSIDNGATTSQLFTRILPPQLLTIPVMKKLYRVIAEGFGGDIDAQYELMLAIGARRRRLFLKSGSTGIALKQVLIPDSVGFRLARLEPPFHTCTRDEINELIEGLIFDALRDRHVGVTFIGTLSGSVGAAVNEYFGRFDSVLAFENGPVIKRPRTKACIYYCADNGRSDISRRVVGRDSEMLAIGRLATNCDIDDTQAMERSLRQLLSIDSWADRAAHARLFRLPRASKCPKT